MAPASKGALLNIYYYYVGNFMFIVQVIFLDQELLLNVAESDT